jgi:hypothetical protein
MAEPEDSKPKLNLIINHAGIRASYLVSYLYEDELVDCAYRGHSKGEGEHAI